MAKELSTQLGAVIAITGEIDIVADEKNAYIIRNGHPMMSKITGTGCMLTAVIGAFCAANPTNYLEATSAGVCAMGICGEHAFTMTSQRGEGTASFKVHLIDFMSKIDAEILNTLPKLGKHFCVQ